MFRRFIINPVCVLALLVLDSIVALWALLFGGFMDELQSALKLKRSSGAGGAGGAGGGAGVVYGSPQEAMDADDDTDFYRRAGAARSGGSGGDGDGGDRGSREGAKRPGAGPNRPAPAEGPRSSGRAPLPTDPEAAIKRLMQCRPEDFYSILNVSRTATAAEIKKNFRLQSLRVHPDKHVGKLKGDAEEAFKKLSFAHEIMGDPDQRRQYEMERNEMAKQQYTEIEDYLRLLKERREEAKRNLFCGVCGKYHPKVKMKDKPIQAARWCNACRTYHAAKEGDVWLETKYLGTKYHIYARIEDEVVDITEWGTCQGLNHLEAFSHAVQITLKDSNNSTGAGGVKKKGGKPGKAKPTLGDGPDDMSVEEFMQMLMKNAAKREAKSKQPPQPNNQPNKKKGGKGKKKRK